MNPTRVSFVAWVASVGRMPTKHATPAAIDKTDVRMEIGATDPVSGQSPVAKHVNFSTQTHYQCDACCLTKSSVRITLGAFPWEVN